MTTDVLALERSRSRILDFVTLTKPGITLMVTAAAAAGYVAASGRPGLRLVGALAGTALAAAGAGVLNMVLERRADARMHRTRNRPIPSGRISARRAGGAGALLCLAGLIVLTFAANPAAGGLAALAIGAYLLLYTPLKTRTAFATYVGAVPGAVPPLIGWAAVTGGLGTGAWLLFLVMFFWQLPHFLSIAWRHRDDYARAGFRVVTTDDPDGGVTGSRLVLQSVALLAATLVPFFLNRAGTLYLVGAVAGGSVMLLACVWFFLRRSDTAARLVFGASILYLPAVLALLAYGG